MSALHRWMGRLALVGALVLGAGNRADACNGCDFGPQLPTLPLLFLADGAVPSLMTGAANTTAPLAMASPAAGPAELSPRSRAFSRDRVWNDVKQQLAFGPRIPGTPEHLAQVDWMVRELQAAGFATEVWEGRPVQPKLAARHGAMPVLNVIGRWGMDRPRRLLFSAHYDTRLYSDASPNRAERTLPVPGANDGASGVAVILEMARVLREHPPKNLGIIIVMHDVEDQGFSSDMIARGASDPYLEYALGAQQLARAWKASDRFEAAINLDLVGEKRHPGFKREGYSQQMQPRLVDEFWAVGRQFAPDLFLDELQRPIIDDHLPYLQRGMPYINVIDLDYREWHTPQDDLPAVSAETLQKVGITCLEFIGARDRQVPKRP